MASFQPEYAPVAGSLWISALIALVPLLVVFVCLGVVKMKAHWACALGLLASLIVAIFAFRMPVLMAASAASEGIVYGIFPITWIVLTAIFLFELTRESGHHDDLMAIFSMISTDVRVLGVLIAFSFCAVLEALAGFGAPVAIVGVMLVAIGIPPLKAAVTVLVGNTFAVPFGAMATPILTGANITDGIWSSTANAAQELAMFISRQSALMAWIVPLLLLVIMDGMRGVKQVWPLAIVVGLTYSAATWWSAGALDPGVTNLVAGIVSLAVGVLMLIFWQPKREDGGRAQRSEAKVGGAKIAWALFPYVLVVAVFMVTQMVPAIKAALAATNIPIHWPGMWDTSGVEPVNLMHTAAGDPQSIALYSFTWLSSPGTILLITGIVIGLCYRMSIKTIWKVFATQLVKMRWTFVTIGSVLGLAYVMNLSGQTLTIGQWIAGAGVIFPFLAPVLGYIGTAVTGSGTSATALFAGLQNSAAQGILGSGASSYAQLPNLLVGANTVGGAVGKMISPQTLAIAAGAVDLKESEILPKSLPWSAVLIVLLCLLVGLQSTPILAWLLPSI